jgi:tRNA pseudouridine32 synthase/23S rRNA pseudouridine746 synthase
MSQLAQQSVNDKNQLKNLVQQKELAIQPLSKKLEALNQEINHLRLKRKELSKALQQQIFSQFRFLNQSGEEKDLIELFENTAQKTPPAGAGECAAPKLLHYAFKSQLVPIALAEFWWGAAPKSEVRKHLNYYGACLGKCKPILTHMLSGMNIEKNPLLCNPAKEKELIIVYQDDALVIINKPAELLSVPGKNIKDSVHSRIKQYFPLATGPLIVHRLDMSTSGLMVIALNKKAHKALQQQFINRTISKHYVALVDGLIEQQSGNISLALCGDYNDRPRQKVCQIQGKAAETEWHVIEHCNDKDFQYTKVSLSPKTGRTHQLRVHCAHVEGLNKPIVGDDLYGTRAKRLYLHAQSLSLIHPISKKTMHFSCKVPF